MAFGDYVDKMRAALTLSDPDLDTSIGTTARKIIDVVAEVADEVSVDKYLLDYSYDINTKTGADLDAFCLLFGFSRLPAKRATGTVTFIRQTPATATIIIPLGTQVSTNGAPSTNFSTVVPALLVLGLSSVEIPVQAILAGTIGNVSAAGIQRFVTSIPGISSFTNVSAITGGSEPESDDQLRDRFTKTIFRNLAGTEAMFLGIALEHPKVTQANVIGALKRHVDQIEIVGGAAVSTIQNASYIFPDSSVFGANIFAGNILTRGVHYTFNALSTSPSIYILDSTAAPDGIYDLEFDYIPVASRNNPQNRITNCIDIYVDGRDEKEATETRLFSNTLVFDSIQGSPMFVSGFRRFNGSLPVAGNLFMQFANAPVLDPSIGNTITVSATIYTENVDYFLVNDVTAYGLSPQSRSGIEWVVPANGATLSVPANGSVFSLDYIFNAVPRDVQVALRDWRLICTDVWVHQANRVLLDIHLAVILNPGFTATSVQATLENDLQALIRRVGFNGSLQTSDILAVAHGVAGIDAVRFVTDVDNPARYAIEIVSNAGTVLSVSATTVTPKRALDVLTGDSDVVVLNSVTLVVKAQNSFGSS